MAKYVIRFRCDSRPLLHSDAPGLCRRKLAEISHTTTSTRPDIIKFSFAYFQLYARDALAGI